MIISKRKAGTLLLGLLCWHGAAYALPTISTTGLVISPGEEAVLEAESQISKNVTDNNSLTRQVRGIYVSTPGLASAGMTTSLTVGDNSVISAQSTNNSVGGETKGLLAYYSTVTLGDGVEISATGANQYSGAAVIALGSGTAFQAGDNIILKGETTNTDNANVNGGMIRGFQIMYDAKETTAEFGNNLRVTTASDTRGSIGVELHSDGGTVNWNVLTIGDDLWIESKSVSGQNAQALNVEGGELNVGENAVVLAEGGRDAWGVRISGMTEVEIKDNLHTTAISTGNYTSSLSPDESGNAYGIMTWGKNGDYDTMHNQVAIGDNAVISAEVLGKGIGEYEGFSTAYGVYTRTHSALTLGDDAKISAKSIELARGIAIIDNGEVNAGKNLAVVVKTQEGQSIGILSRGFRLAYTDGEITGRLEGTGAFTAGEGLTVQVQSDKGPVTGIFASQEGTVKLNGGKILTTVGTVSGAGDALYAASDGIITGNTAKYTIFGNIRNGQGNIDVDKLSSGTISMDFAQDSYWLGNSAILTTDGVETGTTDFVMDGTIWDMTASSQVTNLTFSGAATNVNYLVPVSGDYKTLTVENLAGTTGQFHMNVDMAGVGTHAVNNGAGEFDDLLVVSDGVTGLHQISAVNDGSASVSGEETLTIVQTNDTAALEHFYLQQNVELGGYEYGLRAVSGQSNHLELAATGISNPGDGGVNFFGGQYMLHYVEMQTLMKRLGELREETAVDKGEDLWARVYGGKLTSFGDNFVHSFNMKYKGIQIGADKRHKYDNGKENSYTGGFVGYTDGSSNFANSGSGGNDSYSIGAYWTKTHINGAYIDVVLKYGWQDNDYDLRDSAGQRVTADSDSNVLSLSVELGRKYYFSEQEQEQEQGKKAFYIEPQVQMTAARFSGDEFTATNGLKTKVDGFTSVLGRIGAHLGYEERGVKNPFSVYLKGYLLKEFDGEIEYAFNDGNKRSTDYKDTWFVYGVGMTAKLGKRHNIYLDFERSDGGRLKQDWAVNCGYRYSW